MIPVTDEMREQAARAIAMKPAAIFFPEAPAAIRKGICPLCGEGVTEFRNPLSLDEYFISGMCQKCQDEVFGK